MSSLAVKYRPKDWESVVGQESIVKVLKQELATDNVKNCYLFCGTSGSGKAQPLDSIIQTPKGKVTMRDIQVGQDIFGQDGKIYKVVGKYPQGVRDIYKITLSDGSIVRCDKEHIWNAYCCDSHDKQKYKNVTASYLYDLVKNKNKHPVIRPNNAVEYSEKELPIPPYILGAFLGNGGYTSVPVIYDYYGDVCEECKKYLGDMIIDYTSDRDCNRFCFHSSNFIKGKSEHRNPISEKLKILGIYGLKSKEKYIPEIYLHSSIEQRKLLLAGLMDTDGCKNGRNYKRRADLSYCSVSKKLAYDVLELCRSLGITSRIQQRNREDKGESYVEYYVTILAREFCPFAIQRKREGWRPVTQFYKRKIVSIEEDGKEECCCIMTSNPEGLYLTNEYVTTHNTTLARLFASKINKGVGEPIEIDAASNNSVENTREIIKVANERAVDGEYKIIIYDESHALSNAAWQSLLKTIEEPPKYTIFIFCTTDPQKIPQTILNRVERFNFTKIPAQQIKERLEYICKEEGFLNYGETIEYIAKIANGGMRDAITMLEKCASFNKNLDVKETVDILGKYSYDTFFGIAQSCLEDKEDFLLRFIEDYYQKGFDLKHFIDEYLDFIMDVAKFSIFKTTAMLTIPDSYLESLENLTKIENSTKYFLYIADKFLKIKQGIGNDSNIKATIEITLLQIARLK